MALARLGYWARVGRAGGLGVGQGPSVEVMGRSGGCGEDDLNEWGKFGDLS